jgi:TATA-box binding protein (TBP) (component of TFIID and TFIIIB)
MNISKCIAECKRAIPSFKINTMTLFVKTNLPSHINIMQLRADMPTKHSTIFIKDSKNQFPNCIIFKMHTNSHVVIKVFSTGTFQITGAKNFYTASIAASEMIRFVEGVLQLDHQPVKTEFVIHMINASFFIGKNIKLEDMYSNVMGMNDPLIDVYSITYEKTDHPAINLKLRIATKPITILLFRTGSIIITGVPGFQSMSDAFGLVLQMLNKFQGCLYEKEIVDKSSIVPKKRGRKRKVESEAFYVSFNL